MWITAVEEVVVAFLVISLIVMNIILRTRLQELVQRQAKLYLQLRRLEKETPFVE